MPASEAEIRNFIATHSPLADDVPLADAPFWTTTARAALLQDEILRRTPVGRKWRTS
ncbi:DUF2789 family protein [Cupriavidus basilensis]